MSDPIRISATMLESYAYWKASDTKTTDDLLRDLAHVSPPTRQMVAGRAWARFWEQSTIGEFDAGAMDGWRFIFDLDADIYVPPIREFKVERELITPYGPVTVVGKVDSFEGRSVRDQKLTEKLEIEGRYTDSIQWRTYLSLLDADRFTYDVFVGQYDDVEDEVRIVEYHPITFYTYPGIDTDVERAVFEVAHVVTKYRDQIEALKQGSK